MVENLKFRWLIAKRTYVSSYWEGEPEAQRLVKIVDESTMKDIHPEIFKNFLNEFLENVLKKTRSNELLDPEIFDRLDPEIKTKLIEKYPFLQERRSIQVSSKRWVITPNSYAEFKQDLISAIKSHINYHEGPSFTINIKKFNGLIWNTNLCVKNDPTISSVNEPLSKKKDPGYSIPCSNIVEKKSVMPPLTTKAASPTSWVREGYVLARKRFENDEFHQDNTSLILHSLISELLTECKKRNHDFLVGGNAKFLLNASTVRDLESEFEKVINDPFIHLPNVTKKLAATIENIYTILLKLSEPLQLHDMKQMKQLSVLLERYQAETADETTRNTHDSRAPKRPCLSSYVEGSNPS